MKTILKIFLISLLLILSHNLVNAQVYFQQIVNYKIDVKLDDVNHELSAYESIEYINNSPDELEFIYFHIWPNAYDNNNTALAKQKLSSSRLKLFKVEEQRGYIDSLDFKVNGEKVKWDYDEEHIDICKIMLNQPLKPGEKIIITTPFHVKLPKGVTSRLGHIEQSYQITQWFPKPAVYDKYGWHQFPYINMGEFYSEFGSFDVTITLPKNYVVGATGDLQNSEEIAWLTELADKTSKITSFDKEDKSFPESSKELKTIRFIQKNVHDFAWFADKRFHVLKGEKEMPGTGKKVTTWAMFPNKNADLWMRSLEYIGDALYYYSKWSGDYPYNHCTAVHSSLSAGGGMEYPNITVIGNSNTDRMLEMVIMHEVGHNWFYGILGFNERKYTWQDEGLNSFIEGRYMEAKYGEDDVFYKMVLKENLAKLLDIDKLRYKKFHEFMYLIPARYNIDQSASLSAEEYSGINYGAICYQKSARIFSYLMNYLGEEEFDKIMMKFYEDWKFKHPYPEDIQNAFEAATDENLSWVFDDLLQTTKKLDYKIIKAKNNEVIVKNKGHISSPITINGVKDKKTVDSEWFEGFTGKKTFKFENISEFDAIVIDNDNHMLELYRQNNFYKTKGLFKKVEPLRFRFLGLIEKPERTQISFLPVIGWNNYNKFMLGAAFYHPFLPKNKFEYQIVPMFAFGSKDLAGSVNLAYTFYPYNAKIQSLKMSVSGKRFAYDTEQGNNFHSVRAELNFLLRNKDPRSGVQNRIIISGVNATDIVDIEAGTDPGFNQFYNINLVHKNQRPYHPYDVSLNTQLNKDFGKTSMEANYKWWITKNKALKFRLFAGTFLYKSNNMPSVYNYNLSGIQGINDYTYDHIYFGRFEEPMSNTILGNQFISNDGAFATFTPYGNTNTWLTSLNLTADIPYLPKSIPLKIFFNVAAFGDTQTADEDYELNGFAWEGGVKLSMANEIIEVFLPIVMSEELKNTNDLFTDKFIHRIRFSVRLNKLNPVNLIDRQF